MEKHYTVFMLFLRALITFKVACGSIKSCPVSPSTVEIVDVCPNSEDQWNEAAARKNCSAYASQCDEPDKLVYHCVINTFVNEIYEVCAYGKIIHSGHCAEYSRSGNRIQQSFRTNCTQFSQNPCPNAYYSTDAYKYPGCYDLTKQKEIHSTTGTTQPSKEAITSVPSQNQSSHLERLDAYDRNHNCGGVERVEQEYRMKVPSYEKYKDINKDTVITGIREEAVCAYLGKMNKDIDANVKYIYKSKFLKYVRLACDDGMFFVKAECKAQMKKAISYTVDASFDVDGCVVECQCECAVGMGPSAAWKHVSVVLLALQKFSESRDLITEETCTQNLQTFHHVKPYKGSPIKAEDLPLANETIDVVYDPRPREFRNMPGYQDTFRSIWLNNPSVNKLPVSQLFSIANTVGIDSDHDYFQEKLSEMWLKNTNITEISNAEIMKFEKETCGQSMNPLWQSERCKRIHSSNFGRICKCTERTDKDKLACRLTKYVPQINAPSILHGKCYESVALKCFEEKCDKKTKKCGTFVSKSHPFLAASPDAIIDDNSIAEVKCPYTSKHEKITEESVSFLKNANDSLELDKSHDYYYQIQGQLFCTEKTSCILVVYTFKDLKIIDVQRDQEFICTMLEKLESFFDQHFKKAVLNKFYYHI